jgi:mannose PTS system EIIC component
VCLGVSLFFELLWLDLFPAGTIIPPQSLAPTLASLAVVHHLGIDTPSLAVVVMFVALPLGPLFAQLERYHRQYENRAHTGLLVWASQSGLGPGPAILTRRSILVMLPLNTIVFSICLLALTAISATILPRLEPLLGPIPLQWPHLWVVASVGAVLSLRHRPAYAILLGGVALALASRFVS